ncbi:MAG: polysaccharide deacetylase family protein, partial [Rhodospirillales bacterium]|nr:polysaccharide deacetylase family protein [Rhodospirillales bacterium]
MTNGSSQKCFPGGRRLALSMSFDDGSEHDRRLVDMFNRHGIRGAFHLNSTTLGQDYRVGRNEIRTLYRDHEISCHGATHADLTRLSDDDVRRELSEDKNALEDLCGEPVRGLAYAY